MMGPFIFPNMTNSNSVSGKGLVYVRASYINEQFIFVRLAGRRVSLLTQAVAADPLQDLQKRHYLHLHFAAAVV